MALRPNASANVPVIVPRVIPAQVKFLTIYNPSLGDTEETEKDQILFWAGKDELGTSRPGRNPGKSPSGSATDLDNSANDKQDASKEQTLNERLRQIGLARGMVEFARNFSNDQPLDTIETDRSRIVLHELEKDWWILASIDLTRLPATASQVKSSDESSSETVTPYEFSAREVSPATLLRTQLVKAHNLFLLHHAAGLWELYNRLGRSQFCALLNRFWEGYARKWDVLLHGNPAVDVYGDCIKLAGGGELGVGVGEEEWGSGEREVLEGFIERADGCIECVVGRYGHAPPEKLKDKMNKHRKKQLSLEQQTELDAEAERGLWLGAGEDAGPADGIVFSGVGTISRKSLATVSQWMEAIFKHGDTTYGVGENPASRPRQRRKRPKAERKTSEESFQQLKEGEQQSTDSHPRMKSPRNKAPDLRRKAMENNATPPGIPPPLIGTIERSLDDATAKAAQRSSSKSPKSSPKQEKSEEEAMKGTSDPKEESSMFSVGSVKSILTFGYGSSWTLNPNGFDKKDEKDDKPGKSPNDAPQVLLNDKKLQNSGPAVTHSAPPSNRPAEERLQEIDPTPEVSDEDLPFVQKLEQSIGKFLIGLSGDLENTEFEDTDESTSPSRGSGRSKAQRIFLRTLTVELANSYYQRPGLGSTGRRPSTVSNTSKGSAASEGSVTQRQGPEPKTSAAASVDGAKPTMRHEKVQVAVYVHQPFIFVFLFELHTAKLTMPSFYRSIHHQLGPLQKPLLQRTDPTRVAERIATALNEKASAAMSAVKKHIDNNGNAIYDLVFDPSRNTIRTSIPNIPVPASPDSAVKASSTISGAWYTLGIPIGTSSSSSSTRLERTGAKDKVELWTRVEALNVHGQVLNTFCATRSPTELERTVKTARGWWVLWMKVASPGKESEEFKEAFLVRKSADYTASRSGRDSSIRNSSGSPAGRWLLRDQSRDVSSGSNFTTGGGGAGSLATGAKGVSEGVGVDARKWVEGLLSLTQ